MLNKYYIFIYSFCWDT